MDEATARKIVTETEPGDDIDFATGSGVLVFRKDITKYMDGTYGMLEGVSGECYGFNEEEIIEFLCGKGWYWYRWGHSDEDGDDDDSTEE